MGDLKVDVAALESIAKSVRRAASSFDADDGAAAGGDIGAPDVIDAFERARSTQALMVAWLGATAATLATFASDTASITSATDASLAAAARETR